MGHLKDGKKILLVTSERDITSDFVVLELQRRALPYFRLNTERIHECMIAYRPETAEWTIRSADEFLATGQVHSAYFRRPGLPVSENRAESDPVKKYRQTEWLEVLASFYQSLEGRWLNSPGCIDAAEDKPRQQALALQLGFRLPPTLVTNDVGEAKAFVAEGPTLGKPLRSALLPDADTGRIIYSSRIDALDELDGDSVASAPFILQREIAKRFDVRVTIIGEQVFATNIASQDHEETRTDWRRGTLPDLVHARTVLPDSINEKCIALLHALGLRFGAIDLVEDMEGSYWFLEINPNGQWAWIERRTGYLLSAAIVDELIR